MKLLINLKRNHLYIYQVADVRIKLIKYNSMNKMNSILTRVCDEVLGLERRVITNLTPTGVKSPYLNYFFLITEQHIY